MFLSYRGATSSSSQPFSFKSEILGTQLKFISVKISEHACWSILYTGKVVSDNYIYLSNDARPWMLKKYFLKDLSNILSLNKRHYIILRWGELINITGSSWADHSSRPPPIECIRGKNTSRTPFSTDSFFFLFFLVSPNKKNKLLRI